MRLFTFVKFLRRHSSNGDTLFLSCKCISQPRSISNNATCSSPKCEIYDVQRAVTFEFTNIINSWLVYHNCMYMSSINCVYNETSKCENSFILNIYLYTQGSKVFLQCYFSLRNSMNEYTFLKALIKIFLLQQSIEKFHRLLRFTMYISLIVI